MKKVILPTETLDRIWNDWLKQQELTQFERSYMLDRPYGYGSRRSNKKEKFDLWMFNEGGSIRRVNKKFQLEFTQQDRAILFILRYT